MKAPTQVYHPIKYVIIESKFYKWVQLDLKARVYSEKVLKNASLAYRNVTESKGNAQGTRDYGAAKRASSMLRSGGK